MLEARPRSLIVGLVILGTLLAAGPTWAEPRTLGDGTAEVEIVSPTWLESGTGSTDHHLSTTPGRFGSEARYLRTPDLVVDVSNVSGRPAIFYDLSVADIGVDPPPIRRQVGGSGRYRLHLADVALPPTDYGGGDVSPPEPGTYTGRLVVRVQSFSGQHVVANRTVTVEVGK